MSAPSPPAGSSSHWTINRRQFVFSSCAFIPALSGCATVGSRRSSSLDREIGVTTGSFTRHLVVERQPGKLRLLDLPQILRDELGLRVIDLMTATLPSLEPRYLDELRATAERHGCLLTNLKMNNPGLDLASPDEAVRRHAIEEYKRTMDAAARLGCRWVRPLPGPRRPDLARLAEGYRELMDYGAARGLTLLVENFGWMQDYPDAIPAIIRAVGPGLRSQPDTRNWTDRARYEGLEKAFAFAASCDFKPFALAPDGSHPAYDLKRCFQIGWDAGFRGPWCFEHFQSNFAQQLREMALLRDRLRGWIREADRA